MCKLKAEVKNSQTLLNIYALKKCFCVCMYKVCQINKKAYKKCEIKIIDDGRYFWINRRDLEIESDYKNWTQIFDRCDPKKQKNRHELIPNNIFQLSRVFVRNDLPERKIKSSRLASKQFLDLKEKLVLDPCKINFEEQDIISALQAAFEGEIIHTQYCIENKRLCV